MKNKILLSRLVLSAIMILPNTSAFADEPFIKDFPSMEMSPISEPPTPPESPKPPEEVLSAQKGKRPPIKIEMLPPKKGENKDEPMSKDNEDVQKNSNVGTITTKEELKEILETGFIYNRKVTIYCLVNRDFVLYSFS